MMNRLLTILFMIYLAGCLFAQDKQTNTMASEWYADAPYICSKTDSFGNPAGIPMLFICHDAHVLPVSADLISVNVKVKCASENTFIQTILFDTISRTEFLAGIPYASQDNQILSIQGFDTAVIFQNSGVTFRFIDEVNWWIPPVYHEEIDKRWWYFVYEFPAAALENLCDTIDFEVSFDIDYSTNDVMYLRVIRTSELPPKVNGWYRGDTHVHGLLTDNLAEIGFPYEVMAFMGKQVGLDWITFTDHSCDYDNMGQTMQSNWNIQGDMIAGFNQNHQDFRIIRGIEMSVNNSEGKVVHALVYPDPANPFSLPYFSDGGGDASSTSLSIDMMIDTLNFYHAFCYAAHPFAEGDELPFVVNGSVWNISHIDFLTNGQTMQTGGNVVCNNLNYPSDIFNTGGGIKQGLSGGQILNVRNRLVVFSNENNPWNPFNNSSAAFQLLDTTDTNHYRRRFRENTEVYHFILQQGLKHAFLTNNHQQMKFFQIAGSDAHGSFNYSNTNVMFSIGDVTDNALGKFSTLVYCPDGMGMNGENILTALKNGRAVMSEGPVIVMELEDDVNQQIHLIGDHVFVLKNELQNWDINYLAVTNSLYGPVESVVFTIGTKDTLMTYVPLAPVTNLQDLCASLFGANIPETDFFLYATLRTHRQADPNWAGNDPLSGDFYSVTNPVWISVRDVPVSVGDEFTAIVNVHPNPFDDELIFEINFHMPAQHVWQLLDVSGKPIIEGFHNLNGGYSRFRINTTCLAPGLYFIHSTIDGRTYTSKVIKH